MKCALDFNMLLLDVGDWDILQSANHLIYFQYNHLIKVHKFNEGNMENININM